MKRIGILDPDTSHARVFAEYFRDRIDARVTTLYATRQCRSRESIERFAREFACQVSPTESEFSESVDAVLVLGVDWDSHYPIALRALDNGLRVFVDKPLCGTKAHLRSFAELQQRHPGRMLGGSALPHAQGVSRFATTIKKMLDSDSDMTLFIGGPLDSFFMGIHTFELAVAVLRILGATPLGLQSEAGLRYESPHGEGVLRLEHADAWSITANGDHGDAYFAISNEGIYDGLLQTLSQFILSNVNTELPLGATGMAIDYFQSVGKTGALDGASFAQLYAQVNRGNPL